MTTILFVSKKKNFRKCKECGKKTYPLFLKEISDGICLLNMQIDYYCRTCNEFGEEVYAKDLLKFENPKMREEYVDAHTP
jgi:late competence protein required for DNA uptake (superfamily II DNA/RNA helicase)